MSRGLVRQVRRWMAAVSVARQGRASPAEVLAGFQGFTRRDLLVGAAATSMVPLVGCRKGFRKNPGNARIVVVGGGLSGLSCLHALAKRGLYAELYEAQSLVGGRCLTGRDLFQGSNGLPVELGGQFIDSAHAALLNLVGELGLSLVDLMSDVPLQTTYFVEGQRYTEAQLIDCIQPVYDAVDAAWAQIENNGDTISYQDEAGAGVYDQMSLAAFLQATDPDPALYKVLQAAYLSEYGLDLEDQSALNLILMMATTPGAMALYGDSDERYKIDGGNDQVCSQLAALYGDQIFHEHALTAIVQNLDGSNTLVFENGTEVDADVAVITLPYTVLRQLDLRIEMSDVKKRCIDELGYGTSGKLLQPFSRQVWRDAGETGEIYTDLSFQSAWDATQLSNADIAVLTNHVAGAAGLNMGATGTVAATYLGELETIYPGCSAQAGADPYRVHWPSVPTAMGSYACYKVGQYTGIGGAEYEAVGNLLFAGEHTSYAWQGYLNGAVASGQRAAREVEDLVGGEGRSRAVPRATRRFGRTPPFSRPWDQG